LSQRLNTYLPAILYEILKYGPKYLDEQELETRLREFLVEYRRYLGRELFRGRDRRFWSFHRGKLAELGYSVSALTARGAAAVVADGVFNPKASVEKILRRLARRRTKARNIPSPSTVHAVVHAGHEGTSSR
jgi:hypothetical protein